MSNSANTIIIDLNASNYNREVGTRGLIHLETYEKLKAQIENDLAASENHIKNHSDNEEEKYPPGSGLVYFIDGTRGAGKSTFLKTVYKNLPKNESSKAINTLAYIDPSRIANNENILLSVLKAIADKVEAYHCPKNKEHLHKEYRKSFQNLAKGLSLLSEKHKPLDEIDTVLFLDIGLERVEHSKYLRKNLHALLDQVCELINVDALLLAFDDADTNATHAKDLLECIRCYLDMPRLVILVTGDMELYSILVRDHFFDSLGHSKFDKQDERIKQHYRMVDHLEEQYLLKLFPIQRRYQLRPLWNLLEKSNYKFIIISSTKNSIKTERTPQSVIKEIIRRSLRVKMNSDIDIYAIFLLKQPLRSIVQLFSHCISFLSKSDDDGKSNNEWNEELSNATRNSLRSIALSSLYKYGVDVDGIAAHDLASLINAVFDLALIDGDFDTSAYLRPQSYEENLKVAFTSLSADVAGICAKDPAASLRYMLAGPGSIPLFNIYSSPSSSNLSSNSENILKNYMGIGRNEDASNWARHAISIINRHHYNNSKKLLIRCGSIGLYKNGTSSYNSVLNSILNQKSHIPPFFLITSSVSYRSSGIRLYASIFHALGIIEKLFQLKPSTNGEYDSTSIIIKSFASATVSNLEDVQKNNDTDQEEEENSFDESIDEKERTYLQPIIKAVNGWLNNTQEIRDSIYPSSVLMGKIWNRIYFNLEKISEVFRSTTADPKVSSLMELFALSLLNAFFIEELDYHLLITNNFANTDEFDRTNIIKSPSKFNAKYEYILKEKTKVPFTYLLATCPIITGLINPNTISAMSIKKISPPLFSISIVSWHHIDSMKIMYKKYPTPTIPVIKRRTSDSPNSPSKDDSNG